MLRLRVIVPTIAKERTMSPAASTAAAALNDLADKKIPEIHGQGLGLLQVAGTLDVRQFWPEGISDADTTSIKVQITDPTAFQFRAHPDAALKPTHVFSGAYVYGGPKAQPAIRGIDRDPHITVRLQGIDAPELHFQPPLKNGMDFRQILGETCTVKLKEHLQFLLHDQATLPCLVVTAVNSPDEVFDMYGRFIGDILVRQGHTTININHWLVQHGWAFPSYYVSMTPGEIDAIQHLTIAGKQVHDGVYGHLTQDIADINWSLGFRHPSHHPLASAEPSGKNVLMPKLFRRLATWSVQCRNGYAQDFATFVREQQKGHKECHLLADWLKNGDKAAMHGLDDFIKSGHASNGHFTAVPDQLIFAEAPSHLYDSPHGGHLITHW